MDTFIFMISTHKMKIYESRKGAGKVKGTKGG